MQLNLRRDRVENPSFEIDLLYRRRHWSKNPSPTSDRSRRCQLWPDPALPPPSRTLTWTTSMIKTKPSHIDPQDIAWRHQHNICDTRKKARCCKSVHHQTIPMNTPMRKCLSLTLPMDSQCNRPLSHTWMGALRLRARVVIDVCSIILLHSIMRLRLFWMN